MAEDAHLNPSEKKRLMPLCVFFENIRNVFKMDELGKEIAQIAFPAALALTADPIASLIDTAFIGHLGPVEVAAVGAAIAIFNQVSRIAIFPLVSVTTSFVAEEDTARRLKIAEEESESLEKGLSVDREMKELIPQVDSDTTDKKPSAIIRGNSKLGNSKSGNSKLGNSKSAKGDNERKHIPSASSALVIGAVLGLLEAIFLIAGAKPLLSFMGVKSDSPMLTPARQYLTLRSLGAPAVLLSLAMQGVFRGIKDTKTPLYATVAGDVTNIVLDPIFIFVFHMGVSGAAIAHVISQYLISLILLWRLIVKVDLLPPNIRELQFGRFLKNGFLLLGRVIAATFCVTLAASLAARQGTTPMAAFQICLQVWLASSLLADGLAVAGQAILASAFAEKDYDKVTATVSRVLQLGLVLGILLAVVLGLGLEFGSGVFTKDINVQSLIHITILFVAATQPLNSLAFVFDGVNFGASDYKFSAYSMILVAILTIVSLFLLSWSHGYIGIWIGLTIFMSLRAFAGFWRMGIGSGPWRFLRN